MSNNSFTTKTNIMFGSTEMKDIWWNAQNFDLPGIVMAPPEINTRSGTSINLGSDTVDYEDLNISLILDKQWKVYDEVYAHFLERLNVETGEFIKNETFDLWVEFFDGNGESTKKFWFYDCRLTSFGSISFSTQDPEDSQNTLDLTFVYDYFEYNNTFKSN